METIDISVVIPVYNAEQYLEKCLESVCNQTKKEIEIICVDDGSTDMSKNILECYAKKDSRIKVLCKEHQDGKGAGAARNLGLKNANGKYLCFLDADDFFELDMLELAFEKAEYETAQIVMWDAYEYNQCTQDDKVVNWLLNKNYCPSKDLFSGEDISEHIFQLTAGQVWTMLILSDYVRDKNLYFQETRFRDDVLFAYLSLASAERITIIYKGLVHYRVNTGTNQTIQKYQYIEIMYASLLELQKELRERKLYEKYKASFLNRCIFIMIDFILHQSQYEQFKKSFELFKTRLIDEFELLEYFNLDSSQIIDYSYFKLFKRIVNSTSEEFLFKTTQAEYEIEGYTTPQKIKGKKVIVYGAGKYGRKLYGKLWEKDICDIVAWVDKNYESIGFPVQSPKVIGGCEYEYILISITSGKVAKQISEWLLDTGVNRDKVLFLCDSKDMMKG